MHIKIHNWKLSPSVFNKININSYISKEISMHIKNHN